ncbi:Scr1 family TA system antitoxin-like transcriptional regulator [Actinocorallia sp. API 0066]|uniref:helix-turn-helix domain-containing protein n=1 Tax=Actinocorallia sp. API 0066 TaxID=2896846 RepID=UPI001E51B43D|nr:Scr1 family TA system antitoxin-like transcriptional regulator [Actinocorallia sp. API 0066]MCD0453101.1 Scr1 family TA system antitoxin-like transcriptional regulator [Actinocorallia sp. API 0066]
MSGKRMTPRAFLAKEMRRGREARGISIETLARTLYVSESLVRAWEKAYRIPKPDIIGQIERELGTGGFLARLLAELVDVAMPVEWFGRWREIEGKSSAFWSFQPSLIPGLLQTEEYARAVLRAANHAAVDLEDAVAERLARQAILTRDGEDDDEPPLFVGLVSESALRNNVGGPEVMAAQLAHVLEMVERDNIFFQVVPHTTSVCAGFVGGFVVANHEGNDLAYVDNQLNGEVIDDVGETARLRRWFDVFRAHALSQNESIELLKKMVEQWKT